MYKKLKVSLVLVLIYSIIIIAPVSANSDQNIDIIIKKIVELSGLPEYAVLDSIESIANRENKRKYEVASGLLNEVVDAIPNKSENRKKNKISTLASSPLPYSVPGDIWYTVAGSIPWYHGHVGMYTTSMTIIEARGLGYTVAERPVTAIQAKEGDSVLAVKQNMMNDTRVSLSVAFEAVAWARSKTGSAYAVTLDNKTCGNHDYNCSQLVWCAYRNVTGARD